MSSSPDALGRSSPLPEPSEPQVSERDREMARAVRWFRPAPGGMGDLEYSLRDDGPLDAVTRALASARAEERERCYMAVYRLPCGRDFSIGWKAMCLKAIDAVRAGGEP